MKSAAMTCVLSVLAFMPAVPASAASCDSLATLVLPDTTITLAQVVPAGRFSAPGERQPHGKGVNPYPGSPSSAGSPRRSSRRAIPISRSKSGFPGKWNGKFQAVGNGGWAGSSAIPPWPRPSAPAMQARLPTRGT